MIAVSGCSLDWSESGPGTGGAGTAGAKTGGTGGGSGGTAASTSGGTGGTIIPPAGGSAGAGGVPTVCGAAACLGTDCDAEMACDGGGTVHCCADGQDCATPTSSTTAKGGCVPLGCTDAAKGVVMCSKGCPDLCKSFGLVCCAMGVCQPSC